MHSRPFLTQLVLLGLQALTWPLPAPTAGASRPLLGDALVVLAQLFAALQVGGCARNFFFFSWPAVDAQHPDPVCSWVSPLLPASYPCMPHRGRQALASSPRQTRSCRCRPFPAFHSLPSMHASENWCGQNSILGGRPTCAALPRPHALPCPACAAVHPGGEEPGGSACAGAWHVPLPFHPPWCTCDARRRPTAQACTLPCPVQKLCALRPF